MKQVQKTRNHEAGELLQIRQRIAELEALEAEHKKEEEKLGESEERYRLIAENVTDVIFTMDMNLRFTYISPSVTPQRGYSVEEAMAQGLEQTLTPASLEIATNTILGRPPEEYMDEKKLHRKWTMELEMYCKDGSTIWTEAETTLLYDAEGEAVGIMGVARDITKRRRAEEELKESEQKYRTVLETIEEGYYEVDIAGNFTFFNDSLCRIIGYPPDELMGMNNRQYMSDEMAKAVYEVFNRVYRTGEPDRAFGWEVIGKDGTKSFIEGSISLMHSPSGEPVGFRGIIRDITERKRAEEELKESEQKYRTVLESIEEGYYEVDIAGNLTFFNDSLCRINGYPRDEMMGMNNRQYMSDKMAKAVYEVFNRVYRTGEPDRASDWEVIGKDGTKSFIEGSISLTRGPSGEPVGFRGIVRDITERKRVEEEKLKAITERAAVIDAMGDGLITIGMDGKILSMNPAFERLSGYKEDEIINKDAASLIPIFIKPEEQERLSDIVSAALKGVVPEDETFTLLSRNGQEIPIFATTSFMLDAEGKPATVILILKDITDIKQAKEALAFSKASFRSVVEKNSDGIIVVDCQGRVRFVNPAAESLFGRKADELLKASFGFPVVAGETTELDIFRKGGEKAVVEMRVEETDWGGEGACLASLRDVTERKRAGEERERLLHELERSNAELQQFAHIASHDLQEPLRMVASYTQLLEKRYKDKLDADANEFIAYAVDGAKRMQNLIQGLLSYSRVASRGKPFEPTECESVFKQALDNLKLTIDESGAGVTHDPLPRVMADETQLIQLFQNLLANAIKFRDEKQPRIHVSAKEDTNESLFSVSDNGIGINLEHFDHIFVIFQRLHGREEYPGTGIGLSVCKRIVERHGGRIWVESQPGEGSTFHFTIPKGGEEQ